MSGKFKYSGPAEIIHLNTRKEGEDEERALASDVKLRMKKVPLADLLCLDDKLGEFLFLEGGAVRNPFIAPLTLSLIHI